MTQSEYEPGGGDPRRIVLGDRPLPGATRARPADGTSTSVIALVVGACVVIGLTILVLIALMIESRVREQMARRETLPTQADAHTMVPAPAVRSIPPPDLRLANARLKGNPGSAFGPDAYPVDAMRNSEEGRVVSRLEIDATGTPTSCAVQTSSGSSSLAAATCTIAMRNVRFEPARDGQGVAIASTYMLAVRWVLPNT